MRNSSIARAHCRPSRIAQTISDWPRRVSPAAKTLGTEVLVVLGVGRDIAPGVVLDAELRQHSLVHRMQVAHGEQHQVGLELEFASRHLVQLAVLPFDAAGAQRLDPAALALEGLGLHRPVALAALLMR